MNTAAKDRRHEHRSRDWLEAQGFTVIRSAASKGRVDLIGFSSTGLVLVQVKSARPPSPAERAALAALPVPDCARRLIHVWRAYGRTPEVTVL